MCCNTLIEKLKIHPNCDVNPNFFSHGTSAEEKGQKFKLVLPKGEKDCCRIEIDKRLVPSTDIKKCDFLFQRCKTEDYFFVELKGQNIERAFEQLKDTINLLKKALKMEKYQCHAFICASKVSLPNYSTRKQKFDEEFRKDYGKELRITSSSPDWVVK